MYLRQAGLTRNPTFSYLSCVRCRGQDAASEAPLERKYSRWLQALKKMDFKTIDRHIIPMDDFSIKWRFTEEKYDMLPDEHLQEIKPFDSKASLFLHDFIMKTTLHDQIPFKKNFFKTIDTIYRTDDNEPEIKKWLYHRGLSFDKTVYLTWDPQTSLKTKWKYVVKYWDSFFYSSSDDLTVFDESLNWALLFTHHDDLYWGTNKKYETTTEFNEDWFYEIR
jgi:hypothetical protein